MENFNLILAARITALLWHHKDTLLDSDRMYNGGLPSFGLFTLAEIKDALGVDTPAVAKILSDLSRIGGHRTLIQYDGENEGEPTRWSAGLTPVKGVDFQTTTRTTRRVVLFQHTEARD